MTVTVNGRELEVAGGSTVADLLAQLGVAGPYALVERNALAVERDRYRNVRLEDGDRLVVARPVAGG